MAPQSRLNRRELLRLLTTSALAAPLSSCFGSLSPEEARAALTPTGSEGYGDGALPTHFKSYRDLERLPYFEFNDSGRLRCVVDDAHGAIDFHTHFGISYFMAPPLDLQRRTQETTYLFNCDGVEMPCLLNFNIHQNRLASDEILKAMRRELIRSGLPGGGRWATGHTIPNLLAEMDAMGLERVVVLPIALKLPWDANPTVEWINEARASSAPERLIMFGSVHPADDDVAGKLRAYKEMGVAGVKFHPPMMRTYPDSDEAMAIFQECDRLGLPVLFHAGRAGIEPKASRKYAVMKHYWAPVKEFPNTRFVLGHAGCRLDTDEAREIARRHKNVWMEISGQGLVELEKLKRDVDGDRILYGTDWPYYPLAPGLAKVLMITERDRVLRRMILRENAVRFLESA